MPPFPKALALWAYKAQEDNEISFNAGEIFDIIDLSNDDWYEGKCRGVVGFFPANHCKLVPSKAKDDSEFEDGKDWTLVTTETGMKYYWNQKTQDTMWDVPDGYVEPAINTEGSAGLLGKLEAIPVELIKMEGLVAFKEKKTYGGAEPKKQKGWQSWWAIVCVGHLVFYKDDPSKVKKKDGKAVPTYVLYLTEIELKKEAKDAGKKNLIVLQSKSGAVTLFQPPDNEMDQWYESIAANCKENYPQSEYDYICSILYSSGNGTNLTKKLTLSEPAKSPTRKNTSQSQGTGETLTDQEEEDKAKTKSKLNSFFKRKAERASETTVPTKTKDLTGDEIVFGGTLEGLAKTGGKSIPEFLEKCVEHVELHGLDSQGIYRLSGNANTVQKFRTQINQGNYNEIYEDETDVNAIAACLKLFLRELKVPVIPFSSYHDYMNTMKIENYTDRLSEIKTLVQKLPKVHSDVLQFLIRHLAKVASHSEVNKMEASNLAIVFGPSLIRIEETGQVNMQAAMANMMNMSFQNSLVESMITQSEWLFDGNPK